MKKFILLFFILLSFTTLTAVSNQPSQTLKNSELEETKQLQEEIEKMKIKLSIMEEQSNKINLTYNIDQIYSTANSFYSETINESKEYYKKSMEDVKNYYEISFSTLKDIAFAIIGLGVSAILGIGIFQILDYSKIADKIEKRFHFITKELYQNIGVIHKEIDEKTNNIKKEILERAIEKCLQSDYKSWMKISQEQTIQILYLKKDSYSQEDSFDNPLTFPIAFSNDWISYSIIGDHELKIMEITQTKVKLKGSIKTDCKLIFTGY